MSKVVIAIDGPASSGKSTTAKLVAKKLGFLYLDTGAMYRAITLKCLRLRKDPNDPEETRRVAADSEIRFKLEGSINHVFLDGEDVTEAIRQPQVDGNVSILAKHRKLREVLVTQQRRLGQAQSLIAEGRDTTTVVFPDAIKIYLTADLEERARRRFRELKSRGIESSCDKQVKELSRRDRIDSTREASPLSVDEDASVVDTTHLSIEEQVNKIIQIYREKVKGK